MIPTKEEMNHVMDLFETGKLEIDPIYYSLAGITAALGAVLVHLRHDWDRYEDCVVYKSLVGLGVNGVVTQVGVISFPETGMVHATTPAVVRNTSGEVIRLG